MQPVHSVELTGALSLREATAQFLGPFTLIPIAASLLISTAAFVVMRLYLGAVFRESRRISPLAHAGPGGKEVLQPRWLSAIGALEIHAEENAEIAGAKPLVTPTFHHASTAFRSAALVYGLGGLLFAATAVVLLFRFGINSLPSSPSRLTLWGCYAGVFWSWCFIVAFALAMFYGPDRRLRIVLSAGYVVTLLGMGLLLQLAGAPPLPFADVGLMPKEEAVLLLSFASAVTGQLVTPESVKFSPFFQPIVFWSLAAVPVAVTMVAFNRPIRGTVGPLFVNGALLIVMLTMVVVDLILMLSPGRWLVKQSNRVFGGGTVDILLAIGVMLSAVVGWFGLQWIARRYRRKRLSDQTFLFDALWLSMSIYISVVLMNHTSWYLLGLLPFVLYKIVEGYGLKPLAERAQPLPKARLLFLRVFGSPSRSEKLFDLLSARWRYAGSIQLISATDVARARFEPDEFLDFLGGRLGTGYIATDGDLDRHLAGLDFRTDPDGRYRVNEFFCRSDTWRQTVRRLMAQSDLVAMDLRAFTSKRTGVMFELRALIDEVPLNHVVLLVDKTTDEPFLRRTLAELWQNMSPQSPNVTGVAKARMIDLANGYPAAVRRLLQLGDEILAAVGRAS